MNKNLEAMSVLCIKTYKPDYNLGIEDEKYFIKRSSIYIDNEGTVYGELYKDNELIELLGNVRLDRFMSI